MHYGSGFVYNPSVSDYYINGSKAIEKLKYLNSYGIQTYPLVQVQKIGFNPRV